ncbi:unnamed protein product [Angiostrongylus costaricensis]|uniref:7TM_GPCR_Srx domain-containing protein n=1 Tax=Angiostrongylus costaricensis TaxID=334426 RepID=A0A0R3PP58_ANGCS|nr:unnamed protein product [Angiostrongylus costaricensis]
MLKVGRSFISCFAIIFAMQSLVAAPVTCLVLFEFATAMLLIIGVLIDAYYLMMPFVLNTLFVGVSTNMNEILVLRFQVVNVCLALGVAVVVVNSSGKIRLLYGPYVSFHFVLFSRAFLRFNCLTQITLYIGIVEVFK